MLDGRSRCSNAVGDVSNAQASIWVLPEVTIAISKALAVVSCEYAFQIADHRVMLLQMMFVGTTWN